MVNLILNDKIPECENFFWYEVLYLRQWKLHAYPTKDVAENIIQLMIKIEWIRDYLGGWPIKITSGWRPAAYNELIGGAFRSAHLTGEAVDFQVKGYDAHEIRDALVPLLERLQIRMENHNGNWIHIDSRAPSTNGRYFKP